MASIIDRGKGRPKRWQVKYRVTDPDTGEVAQRSESFALQADARAFKAEVEVDDAGGALIDPRRGDVPFGVFTADNLDSLCRPYRPSTAARFRAALDSRVLPRWRRVPLGSITHTAVQRWIDGLTDAGLAPATVTKTWLAFRRVMTAAVAAKLIAGVPWGELRLPAADDHEARFLTPAEVDRLADAIGDRWRALVYVGAVCGLRAGELFALRWADVNFAEGWVEVARNVTEADGRLHHGAPKTKAGRRRVPMPRVVVDELELHRLTVADPAGLVFPDAAGGPVRANNFRKRVWRPACSAAGLDGLVMHELRHTAVAGWIEAGATPDEIKARAGHRSVVTILDVYGHRFPTQAARVNDNVDAMYRQARAR